MAKQIESYLRALKRQLWLRGVFDKESLAEVESHLLEAVEAGMRRGLGAEESERQALGRFGSVKVVSRAFEKERNNLMQNLLNPYNLKQTSVDILTLIKRKQHHNH